MVVLAEAATATAPILLAMEIKIASIAPTAMIVENVPIVRVAIDAGIAPMVRTARTAAIARISTESRVGEVRVGETFTAERGVFKEDKELRK